MELAIGGIILPRVFGNAQIFNHAYSTSHIRDSAKKRQANPTRAETELQRILNSLNGGVLRGRFKREHVVSGKWVAYFFFPDLRLAIEVDGSVHNTRAQRAKDREKDADCKRFALRFCGYATPKSLEIATS